MNTDLDNEEFAGREAADRLCRSWPDVTWAPPAPSTAWARGAIERFGEIVTEQLPIFRASQQGAEKSAGTLSPRSFQGLSETLQNADDLAAAELRIAFRSCPRPELLLVHDGRPVLLKDMGAMVLPWLSAKEDDDEASGRFGIGQKTLKALGDPIAMHCAPFHFEMHAERPISIAPGPRITGIYDPERRDTMVLVPLKQDFSSSDIRAAVAELGVQSLLFLKSVRRLTFVDLDAPDAVDTYALGNKTPKTRTLPFFEQELEVEAMELKVVAPTATAGQLFWRYWAKRDTPAGQERANKATGKITPLGLCIARTPGAHGHLYDRVRMPVEVRFPVSLNAQFDPDAARSTVLPVDWNRSRFRDLGELLSSVALSAFEEQPASGWSHVPLSREVESDEGWLADRLRTEVAGRCRERLTSGLRLPDRGGDRRPLSDFAYEIEDLDGLLTPDDQAVLAEDAATVALADRDPEGRWREVLAELGLSRALDVSDALDLFDLPERIAYRDPDWFVRMAELAGRHNLFDEFQHKRSILLADGRVVVCPKRGEPRTLVRTASPGALAVQLGLAWPLHPAYLSDEPHAQKAVEWLSKAAVLADSCDEPGDALELLSRSAFVQPAQVVKVDDADLLVLRDAWARLPREQQRTVGERIGTNIQLRVVYFVNRREKLGWAQPNRTYLPGAIDKEVDSFAKASGPTSGLLWIDSKYGKLLRQSAGRSEAGAQRFLTALGVARAPRLRAPPNERQEWARDTRRASAIHGVDHPPAQVQAVRSIGGTHLIGDRWSPDLEAVIDDIRTGPAKTRRKRALGLLSVLARNWDRRYAEYETAEAVSGYNGYWNRRGDVQATWLARLASVPWLPNGANGFDEPNKLCLPTPANKLAHGTNRRAFLAQVPPHVAASGLLRALGVQPGPTAMDLLERLQEHRGKPVTAGRVEQVHALYQLLARNLKDSRAEAIVGRAVTPHQLRNAFRATTTGPGLVLTDDGWHSPEAVLCGPPIFGRWRAFAPHVAGLEPLWAALKVPWPTASDCTAVLRELSAEPLSPQAKGVMLSALRALGSLADQLSPQLRTALRRLPLWTGTGWSRARPAYIFEGDAFADAELDGAIVWRPGLTTLQDVERLLPLLGVVPLGLEHFTPTKLTAAGLAEGRLHRSRFLRAVALLAEELVRGDVALYQALVPRWDALLKAEFILEPDLHIETVKGGLPVKLPARAHFLPDPPTFVARCLEDAGDSQTGGQAVASLFRGDRQKVAWAWSAVWARASAGQHAERIVLPQLTANNPSTVDRLSQLKDQVGARTKAKEKAQTSQGEAKPSGRPAPKIEVRRLRDLSELEPSAGTIVNKGITSEGVVFAKPQQKVGRTFDKSGSHNTSTTGYQTRTRTVLPPSSDREDMALEAIRRALCLDHEQIKDMRQRRGVGVDAIDELRQCYELKMESGGTFPSEVKLEQSQVQAALEDPDFFLALVAGLEDGQGVLKVRFIFNPLQVLAAKIQGGMTLTGVDKVEALEFEFTKGEVDNPPSVAAKAGAG